MKSKVLMLALVLLSLPLASAQAAPTCADLERWAASLPELPKDYETFAALPEANRRAVYPLLTAGERAALWQAHWQAALADGGFSGEQQALIQEAIATFDESAFAALRPDARNGAAAFESLQAFATRVAAVFGQRQATRLFAELGPVSTRQIFEVEPGGFQPGGQALALDPVIDCSCSTASDFCSSGSRCLQANCRQITGCGLFWNYICNGLCVHFAVPADDH